MPCFFSDGGGWENIIKVHSDLSFTVSLTCHGCYRAITSSGTKKGELLLADVSTQIKNNNITTDIKVDTNSRLITTVTVDEPTPGLKAIFNAVILDQSSGKVSGIIIFIIFALFSLNDKGDTLNASYYHIVNPLTFTVVGAEVSHSFSKNENTFTIGTTHSLDLLTSVKAKMNNSGKVSALLQHEWHPKSLITFSGEVDVRNIEKSSKVGLALALKA
ncbi:Voltage-dependent anion-selective channel protein 1 [Ranunculus cassubicifolius]